MSFSRADVGRVAPSRATIGSLPGGEGGRPVAPGRLYGALGRRLHLWRAGRGHPTVVLEAGRATDCLSWTAVLPRIAERTTVCAYDRAGLGWSAPARGARTLGRMVAELRALLSAAGLPPPYILVGHSAGGHVVRAFAARHAADVAGLVLVDTPTEFDTGLETRAEARRLRRQVRLARLLAPLGIPRLVVESGRSDRIEALLALYPEASRPAARALLGRPSRWVAAWNELRESEAALRETARTPVPARLPLAVVTADDPARDATARRRWLAAQERLARLSERHVWFVVERCGHYVPLQRPEAVVLALDWVLDQCPGGTRAPATWRGGRR